MRRLWHRFNFVPSPTRCIYCTTIPRTPLYNTTPGFFQLYSTLPTITPIQTHSTTTTTPTINKATLLADFYRALATQDIDYIWPLYTYFYNNNLLHYLTKSNYHNIFAYTVRNRTTQKNLQRLCALVDDMKSRGIQLTLSEYNALMDWVGGKTAPHRHAHHLTDALAIFEEMEKENRKEVMPQLITFNILINIASHLSDIRTAQKLYHNMISRGLQPDVYTYTPLLYAMSKTGDMSGMDKLIEDIKATKCKPLINNTILWNVVMSGYAKNGCRDKAMAIFKMMKRKKKCDGESYKIYIETMVHEGKIEEAIDTLQKMTQSGIKPIITIYNTLFASFMVDYADIQDKDTMKKLELLHTLYQSFKKSKIQPNSETMYTLVSAYLDLGDTKSALETFVFLSNSKSIPRPTHCIKSSSVATLAQARFLISKSSASKLEPPQELIDRLNVICKPN